MSVYIHAHLFIVHSSPEPVTISGLISRFFLTQALCRQLLFLYLFSNALLCFMELFLYLVGTPHHAYV